MRGGFPWEEKRAPLRNCSGILRASSFHGAPVFFCLNRNRNSEITPGGSRCFLFEITPGESRCSFEITLGSCFLKSRLGDFGAGVFWKSRLEVPVLALLHSCLWAGAFFLLNSRLGAPFFVAIHASWAGAVEKQNTSPEA